MRGQKKKAENYGVFAEKWVSDKSFGILASRRDLNPCYRRRESGMAKRNSNKLQEHGRTGLRSRSSKKQLIVSPDVFPAF